MLELFDRLLYELYVIDIVQSQASGRLNFELCKFHHYHSHTFTKTRPNDRRQREIFKYIYLSSCDRLKTPSIPLSKIQSTNERTAKLIIMHRNMFSVMLKSMLHVIYHYGRTWTKYRLIRFLACLQCTHSQLQSRYNMYI